MFNLRRNCGQTRMQKKDDVEPGKDRCPPEKGPGKFLCHRAEKESTLLTLASETCGLQNEKKIKIGVV